MIDDALVLMAKEAAAKHALDPALVCAVIEQESGGDTWAFRYEPDFYARYIQPMLAAGQVKTPAAGTVESEAFARATSWGLMQVIGESAREAPVNYYGPLPALCDPATGIDVGCRLLARKLELAESNVRTALLLWNGGADQNYPLEVMAKAAAYK